MKIKQIVKKANIFKAISAASLSLGSSVSAYAATATTIADISGNVQTMVSQGIGAVKAVAMIAGLILLITGIMSFKQHANDMQGTGGHAKKGMVSIVLGACLLLAPTVLSIIETSLLGTANTSLS